ncbi:multidrug ABC transporter permease [Halorubrum persicum]|uniref:Multidrug ABC transporter permease n=1 Tax=Halorubrum persicum TaxID=1383844 RepID=A0A2G1WHN4_9EURY|nr:ABC transporter ATP-binding protein [Halorubrum persicum]PHQ38455.1 multidrug ABC transporter permease [Halorubrum persicum]
MSTNSKELLNREKLRALRRVAEYRPLFTFGLVCFGAFVALLEGVGLSFIYPILETAQSNDPTTAGGPVMELFISTYQFFNIPFSLGYLITGVALVMTVRYTMSFLAQWFASILAKQYEKHLRTRAFEGALDAEVSYYDEAGSDDILNAIITETRYSALVIRKGVQMLQMFFLVLMYVGVMFYITPSMTIFAMLLLGGITVLLRVVIEPAVTVGSRVAEANERVQETVQAGTQGIRDVKLFGLRSEVFSAFSEWIDQYAVSEVDIKRNEAAIKNLFELSAAVTIFALIYIGFTFTGLALGELGIFLIAMFQLAPRVSSLNRLVYSVEGYLSHLGRTHIFLDEFDERQEQSGDRSVDCVSHIEFDDVEFSYTEDEQVLRGLSFDVTKEDFVAFVGQSGAGKSTIVSLLARMYDPDTGEIRADGVPIQEYDIEQWRERIAVVRQQPYIFTDTLEDNVTIGNRDATRQDVKRVCEIAKVDEFVDELPNGYDSQLGDDGVRLSGGQRQRVALARALLKDADFLVLDEATSDLDSSLESEVQAAIESMDREYGIIAIAHRLSTIQNADRIYTVENGQIVESGSHEDLLEDNGEYAKLHDIQSGE